MTLAGGLAPLPAAPPRAALAGDREAVEASLARVRAAHVPRLAAAARHSLLSGGKRLRPLLSCAVMRAFGVAPDGAIDLVAAVELIHCGTLLHDDIIDRAATRRGRPAAHVAFDPHTAILAGDFLLAAGLERLGRSGVDGLQAAAAAAIARVCEGEVLEREHRFDPEVDLARARLVNHLKTAVLFGYAAEAGALLAGAPPAARAAARAFGAALGDAFQTVDDLLDWQGDADVVGKPVGHDLAGGLVTVPVALGCERDPELRPLVRRVLGAARERREPAVPLAEIRARLERAAAFAGARALAAADAEQARAALAGLPAGPWRDWLDAAATAALARRA